MLGKSTWQDLQQIRKCHLKYQDKGQKERVMEIKVTQADNSDLKPRPADESQIGFGDIFTDHMFLMDYESEPAGKIPA